MGIEDKTLFCFCHWGRMNKVLPNGSISYGGGITDQVIAKTGIKYNDFVNAVFERLGIDPSDKMLHFTVKFDRSELIRLRDQKGVDTLLQFNEGYAHVYASSLEKEPYSRPPPGGTKSIIAYELGSQGAAHRPKQSQPGDQDMPLKSNLNKPFEQTELPNQGTSKTTAVSAGFPPIAQTGSRQGPEIYATDFNCNAQLSNINHHKYTQPTSSAMQEAFWTECPSCKVRYHYYSTYLNCTVRCQKCPKTFTAYNVDSRYRPGLNSRTAGSEPEKCRGKTAQVLEDIRTKQKDKLTISMKEGTARPKVDCKSRKRFRKQIVESSESDDASIGVETEDMEIEDRNNPPSGDVSDSDVIHCPNAEFSDFDIHTAENCFAVNQIWACYDTADGMPRFYANIRKVSGPEFKIKLSWVEAYPENQREVAWVSANLPVVCGKFRRGASQYTSDRLMFSHQVECKMSKRGLYVVYPKKGETWAIFKDWNIHWSSNPENHRKYKYEFVEILSDYVDDIGVRVGYFDKVTGFVSLFQRRKITVAGTFFVKPNELYKFSHRIPSFKMTGTEGEGVPAGSFELEPASLPFNPDGTHK